MKIALEIQNTFNLAMFYGERFCCEPKAQTKNARSLPTENVDYEKLQYDYHRLTAINYPLNPENNVKYHYGTKHANHNRIGRLALLEDASGAQEFFYGRMGELNKVRRTHIIPNHAVATFETTWKYDSWNRVQEMIYPDKEKLTYHYDAGGQLEGLTGNKAYSYNYVQDIGYDKFGQRTYIKYCNGTETTYNYDPKMRRLEGLTAQNQSRTFMDNAYSFDKVGNILGVSNKAEAGDVMGGLMSHTYSYDGLYRLASAQGEFTGSDNKVASYSLEMGYDNMHNITSKKQHITQTDVAFEGELLAGYELAYNYRSDKPHQLESINDNNYRTADSTAVESSIKNLQDAYTYDSNGNLLFVNTADSVQTNIKERQLSWDEENRLRSICDNGYVSSYFYDAAGARTVKLHGSGEGIHVNSAFSGGYTNNVDYTLYVDAYMVLEKGGQYTKHIYIGDQRIVSKLGDVGSFGVDPRREQYAGEDVAGVEVPDYKTKYEALQNVIKDNYQLFEVDYYGVDNDNYVDGEGFCCEPQANTRKGRSLPTENVDYEKLQYYYHPDHLGSASYITNLDGEVVQHIEYVPFGEVFLEERNNTWNTPFLFNGKELDEETGLYYYGARYYNPRISLWYGVDPLAEKYPAHSPYCYTMNNPIMLVDPDGEEPITLTAIAIRMAAGAAIGAGIDFTTQMATNMMLKDHSFGEAFSNVDWTSVGASAAIGAVGVPGSNLAKSTKTIVTATAVAGDAMIDITNLDGNKNIFNGEKSLTDASIDVAGAVISSKVSGAIVNGAKKAVADDIASGAYHTLTKGNKAGLRQIEKTVSGQAFKTGVEGTIGFTTSGLKDGAKTTLNSDRNYLPPIIPDYTHPSDNTRVVQPKVLFND